MSEQILYCLQFGAIRGKTASLLLCSNKKSLATVGVTIGMLGMMLVASASVSYAGTTEWMSQSQLDSYAKSRMTGKFYATAINCKDSSNGPLLKLNYDAFPEGYTRMTGIDLFYRWYWLISKSSGFTKAIAKIRPKEKPHLKWRVVHQSSYVDAAGVKMTCAVLYR